jgi:hypothetical protein
MTVLIPSRTPATKINLGSDGEVSHSYPPPYQTTPLFLQIAKASF